MFLTNVGKLDPIGDEFHDLRRRVGLDWPEGRVTARGLLDFNGFERTESTMADHVVAFARITGQTTEVLET